MDELPRGRPAETAAGGHTDTKDGVENPFPQLFRQGGRFVYGQIDHVGIAVVIQIDAPCQHLLR